MPNLPNAPEEPPRSPGAGARDPTPEELRGLRFLRGLVTVLAATMIAGVVAIVVLLYLRLPGGATASAPAPALPDTIALPAGTRAQAVTAGPGWWAVVTAGGDILLYDGQGSLLRRIAVGELARD
jgi:hypothetical protein